MHKILYDNTVGMLADCSKMYIKVDKDSINLVHLELRYKIKRLLADNYHTLIVDELIGMHNSHGGILRHGGARQTRMPDKQHF
jgi:hypothetical protein